ncbi:hypothetical protein ACFX1Z_030798 [Malus domestica]
MVSSSDMAYNCGPSLLDDLDTALRAKRRWRMAFLALRVVRVMLELPKEIVSRAKKYGDVEIDHNSFVSDVDDHEDAGLAETVKEKNLAAAKRYLHSNSKPNIFIRRMISTTKLNFQHAFPVDLNIKLI